MSAAALYILSDQNERILQTLQEIRTGLGWTCFLLVVLIFCSCVGWLKRR
jgi:hypothetical protein